MKPHAQRARLLPDQAELGWTTRAAGRPAAARSPPSSRSAAALQTVMAPSLSTPTTPAGTPESTASMKARRSSLSALASIRPVCCWSKLRGHLVERVAKMAKVAIGSARRHMDVEVAGADLVGCADQAADRPDQPVRPGQPEPDRRKQHGQRQHDEHGGEAELQTAPMRLEPAPHGWPRSPRPRRPWRQRIDAARGVEELAFGAGNRPDGDEDVANAEKAAQVLARQRVLEVGRVGSGDKLRVGPVGDLSGAVGLHQRCGAEAERLRPRAEVVLELAGSERSSRALREMSPAVSSTSRSSARHWVSR